MTLLEKARTTAERAREQATHGLEAGRRRMDERQVRRQYGRLTQRLGEALYSEHRGEGTREAVVQAITDLDAHVHVHPVATAEVTTPRRARDIMHPGATCVAEDDSLADAAQKMRDLGVGSLPICGADDRLHGILTDRDIVLLCVAEGRDPSAVRAGELAQGTLFWADADAEVAEVVREMEEHQVKRLPVLENHRLVGVISEADLARNLSEHRLAEFVEKVYAAR